MQHLLQLWEKHFITFQWCKWWTGLPLTCSEAEFILLLAFIVVECPDSHASVLVFIEGVKTSIRVFVCIGCVCLVLLITADAAKCVLRRRNVSCAESIIANVKNYFSYCHSLLYNNIISKKYNNCNYHIYCMKNNNHNSLQSTQTQKAVRRTFKFISVQLHLFWSPLGQWPTADITLVSMTPSLPFFDLSFFEMLWVRSGLYSWNKICYVLYNSS